MGTERKMISVVPYERDYGQIDVELDNHNVIMLNLKSKCGEPLFAEVISERLTPHTDGGRVYWCNGASLTLEEIVVMLQTDDSEM